VKLQKQKRKKKNKAKKIPYNLQHNGVTLAFEKTIIIILT
jgi:hypothetical protein